MSPARLGCRFVLVATWILALSTLALAIEGGAALRGWLAHLRVGRRRRELDEMKREISLLHHAVWMDVAVGGQGSRPQIDERVRNLLMSDGWRPDAERMAEAGYFDLRTIQGD